MKLEDYIYTSIEEYPSLYLCETYAESRLCVLHQSFLVLGNGLRWAETKKIQDGGYLTERNRSRTLDTPYGKHKVKNKLSFGDLKEKLTSSNRIGVIVDFYNQSPYPFSEKHWLYANIDQKLIKAFIY